MGALFVYVSFTAICVAAIFNPSIGIIGYVGCVALSPQWVWSYSLDPAIPLQRYIAIFTLIGLALNSFRGVRQTRIALGAQACLVGFLGVSLVSTWQSIVPERSWFFMDVFTKEVVMFCVACRLLNSAKVLWAAAIAVILGIGWNAYEINLDYLPKGYSLINQDGWAGQNANGYALLLLLALFLTLSVALHVTKPYYKVGLLFIAALDVHAIFIVEARGAMLGCVISFVLLIWYMEKSLRNFLLIGALSCIGLVLAGPSVVKEFSSSFASKGLDESAASRFYVWEAGLKMTLDKPLLGFGPWAAEFMVPQYYSDPQGVAKDSIHLHNLPLEVSTGMGIPALLLYASFFFFPTWRLRRVLRQVRALPDAAGLTAVATVCVGLLAGIPGYWFASLFNSGALIELPYLLLAFALAASNLSAELEARESAGEGDPLSQREPYEGAPMCRSQASSAADGRLQVSFMTASKLTKV